MLFQYLGTAAAEGWPAVFCDCEACREALRRGGRELRSRSGAVIDNTLLIDLNPDLYMQKLMYGIDLTHIRDVVITHAHEDHLYPENVLMLNGVNAHRDGLPKIHIYGSETVREHIPFLGKVQDKAEFHVVNPGDRVTTSAGYHVTVLKAEHGMKDAQCFYIEKDGAGVLYAHDTEMLLPEAWAALRRDVKTPCRLISMDCTNGPLEHFYYGHMGFDDNVEFRGKCVDEGIADENTVCVLNHFSHNGHMLYKEASERMEPKGFLISYDGMKIDIK